MLNFNPFFSEFVFCTHLEKWQSGIYYDITPTAERTWNLKTVWESRGFFSHCTKCHMNEKLLKNTKWSILRGNSNHKVNPMIDDEFQVLTSTMQILSLRDYSYNNNAYTGDNYENGKTNKPTRDHCFDGWMQSQSSRNKKRVKS